MSIFRRSKPTAQPAPELVPPSLADIVRRSRLLVIDDKEFPLIKLFARDGYAMDKWDEVLDLNKLVSGAYDLILLDLRGVGMSDAPDEEGLGVLRYIKKEDPTQLVIAFSHEEFNMKYREFVELADASLHKSADSYVVYKETVDRLLRERQSVDYYIDKLMERVPVPYRSSVDVMALRRSIMNQDKVLLESVIAPAHKSDIDLSAALESIAVVAMTVVSKWDQTS